MAVYHCYRKEYSIVTGSLAKERLKGFIFLPLISSRKNNYLSPVISYIATRITLDPIVWLLIAVLQHDGSTMVEEKVKERLKRLDQKGSYIH